jgi:hypothetical protein
MRYAVMLSSLTARALVGGALASLRSNVILVTVVA